MSGWATPSIDALAKKPLFEKAARALATEDRGHDDDYFLYDEDVEIVLRETGAAAVIKDLMAEMRAADLPCGSKAYLAASEFLRGIGDQT